MRGRAYLQQRRATGFGVRHQSGCSRAAVARSFELLCVFMSAMAEPIWDVFLAHAGPDKATAEKLYTMLVNAGKRVFLDCKVLQVGDDWHQLIPAHQDASIATVSCCRRPRNTPWYERAEVVRAVSLAREHGHTVMPVKLIPGAMSYGLEALHALEAFDDLGLSNAAEQIVAALDTPTGYLGPWPGRCSARAFPVSAVGSLDVTRC